MIKEKSTINRKAVKKRTLSNAICSDKSNENIKYPQTSQSNIKSNIEELILSFAFTSGREESLLGKIITQWQYGEWSSIAEINYKRVESNPEGGKIALLVASALLQIGKKEEARKFVSLAEKSNIDKKLILQILISGVHNTLGLVNNLIGKEESSEKHFKNSIEIGSPWSESELIFKTRQENQLKKLNLLSIYEKNSVNKMTEIIKSLIEKRHFDESLALLEVIIKREPDNIELLIDKAEIYLACDNLSDSIKEYQHICSVLNERTPQIFYNRLHNIYKKIKSFPKGTIEEEARVGDVNKHEILKQFHDLLKPEVYFEIGVQKGTSFKLSNCKAIGVDPMPMINFELADRMELFECSSDLFFEKYAASALIQRPDLVFIDGMHLFEYVLRDFINTEKFSKNNTLIVVDDIYPNHPAQATRDRKTCAWTGDVWKLYDILKIYRPDLFMITLNSLPTGFLIITCLDSNNHLLEENYSKIIDEYIKIETVPEHILHRENVTFFNNINMDLFINKLNESKKYSISKDLLYIELTKALQR